MERRTLLAVLLTMALLIGYTATIEYIFPRPAAPPQAESPAKPADPQQAAETSKPPEPRADVPLAPVKTTARPAAEAAPQSRLVPVETNLYRAVVSSEGGKLQEFVLKYRGDKPLVLTGDTGPQGLAVATQPGGDAVVVPFEIRGDTPTGQTREVVLTGSIDGLKIQKTLRFESDTYVVSTAIRIENPTSAPRSVTVTLPWATRQAWNEAKEKFPGQHPTEIVYRASAHVERIETLCDVPARSVDGGEWIAVGSTWYLAAIAPKGTGFRLALAADPKGCETKSTEPTGRATVAAVAATTIPPGQAWEGGARLYIGPKEYDRLRAQGLEETLNFGGFPVPRRYGGLPMEWLGVPILLLMNWVYERVGNYGVAIILLTVVSKVLFFPLTVKSMRSMKAMQALQPQINALRSKHKKDPQALQRETLELYRKHKVNPMGGCLPMVAQIPIFYALYLALSVSVDLQNAAFLCFGHIFGVDVWICDLASQDPTYVLPILMGVTMFVQQRMTPTMADPRQARMMLLMPVVFTFMFLNLPSGLVLYWTVSNILQIAQQYYMDRPKQARAAREAKDASRA
jgi:YidC/Oxa1 family membrane protein insertase